MSASLKCSSSTPFGEWNQVFWWPCPMTALWLFAFLCTTLPFSLMESLAGLEQQSCCGVWGLCSLRLSSSKGYLSATPTPSPMRTASIRMPWGCQCWHLCQQHPRPPGGDLRHCGRCLAPLGLFLSNLPGSIGHCFLGRDTQGSQYPPLSYLCCAALLLPLIGMTVIHCFGKHLSPVVHTVIASTYLPLPPLLSQIVYSVRTKQAHQWIVQVSCGGRVGS